MAAVTNLSARLIQRSLQSCMRPFMMGSVPQAGRLQKSQDAPKRPSTAFSSFVHDKFPVLRQANVGLPPTSIMRMAGELWNNLPPAEKNKYAAEYQKNLAAYKEAFNKLPESQKDSIRQQGQLKRIEKKKRRVKKLASDLGKPKRIPSAYLLFYQSRYNGLDKNLKLTAKARLIGEEWKGMSAAQRKPFVDEYNTKKEAHDHQLEMWEAKVKAEGHPELVRGFTKEAPAKKPTKKKTASTKAAKKSAKGKPATKKVASKKG